MTGDLAAMLAGNDATRVDPRTQPVRFHHLKAMGRSAAHCYESFQADGESTLSRRLGSGAHALAFGQPVALWDRPAKKGKGKAPRSGAEYEEFKAEHAGAVILNRKEYDRAMRIATALGNHPHASSLLFRSTAVHERTILWSQNGRDRRSTPDCWCPDSLYVAELKTTRCAAPDLFRFDVKRMAYHAQLADQMDAIEFETGRRPREAYIIAVETVAPFVVQTFRLTDADIDQGARIVRLWFESFRVAEDANAWGGYSDTTIDLDLSDGDDLELTFADDEPSAEQEDE